MAKTFDTYKKETWTKTDYQFLQHIDELKLSHFTLFSNK